MKGEGYVRILGVDPGSNKTGFGIIDSNGNKYRYVKGGCLRLSKSPVYFELQQILQNLSEIIEEYKPQEFAIEQVFMKINVNSALKLGQARGVALVAAVSKQLLIAEYSARQVKQAVVGYGAASKEQVQHMIKLLLQLKENPEENMADAFAVAICHANMRVLQKIKSQAEKNYDR
jgi:crossover junction endodeoxyribonuclease RuvC